MLAMVLALGMALSLVAVPTMVAATPGATYTAENSSGWVEITSVPDTWTFHIEHPYALGLDADYWNITVYAENSNLTATNATYYIHVHIYDGATNLTNNKTLACKNDKYVYANVSIDSTAIGTMVANSDAVYYVELIKANEGIPATYKGSVSIVTTELSAGFMNAIMVIIPLIIMVMIIGWLSGLIGSISGKIRRK